MDRRKEIADNIAAAIKGSGKTQAQIALEVGITKTVISDYIAGRSVPSVLTLAKLCAALDCTYEDILGRV